MAITRLGGANAISGTIPQGNIANASLGAVTALPAAITTGTVLQVITATELPTQKKKLIKKKQINHLVNKNSKI